MFSVENLYYILYVNLFKKIKASIFYFSKFGSTDYKDLLFNFFDNSFSIDSKTFVLCLDQEPIQITVLDEFFTKINPPHKQPNLIIVSSEHSNLIKNYCKTINAYHLYYFFHGFASLSWYRDCFYFDKNVPCFSNRFISFNRICSSLRSYRLLLASELIERKIINHGKFSLQFIKDNTNIIKKELVDNNCRLSKHSKIKIYNTLINQTENFVIDKEIDGTASAHLGCNEFELWQSCFLHVVSETVFFEQKLHLTEKIFKPIVSQRPFILLGAYKNLEYLKSYGFKTFDKWIDESYDNEPDNEIRLMMVCDEVEKIANLSEEEIKTMYWDMQQVIDHNYRHFYTDFKQIIVNELVDNFEGYMRWYNNGRLNDEVYNIESLNLPEVKRLLAQ